MQHCGADGLEKLKTQILHGHLEHLHEPVKDGHYTFSSWHLAQYVLHKSLKGGWDVTKPKYSSITHNCHKPCSLTSSPNTLYVDLGR